MVALVWKTDHGEALSMYILETKACILWLVNENRKLLSLTFNKTDLNAFIDSPELWRM
jgi:hypothetical protein